MDCIAPLYGYMNPRIKAYWVVEGDIRGCFDHIQHAILLKLIEQRVADQRIVALVRDFLRAGVMEGVLFRRTEEALRRVVSLYRCWQTSICTNSTATGGNTMVA